MRLVIGTRGSPLALGQAEQVAGLLRKKHPALEIEIRVVQTSADAQLAAPLSSLPRGVFAKELETALLRGEIDAAVHSFKDLPTELDAGLSIAAITLREDARDVLVAPGYASLEALPQGARLGTSSPRRTAQLRAYRRDLNVEPVRGNVGTRIGKAGDGGLDGVVLAAAGVHRLGLRAAISAYLDPDVCTPEAGQGALAVEIRAADARTQEFVAVADDESTRAAVTAEVAVLRALGGGCKVPIGSYAERHGTRLLLRGVVADVAGAEVLRAQMEGEASAPVALGAALAERLRTMGAMRLLEPERL